MPEKINLDSIQGVLFDLDGTLLDTAPDIAFALNLLRKDYDLEKLPFNLVRPLVGLGSKKLLQFALGINDSDPDFQSIRERFYTYYLEHIANETTFFPDMEKVLDYLDRQQIPWGIVTNKLTAHSKALLTALSVDHRPACLVSGDSLPTYKPDPEPIIHACQLLKRHPHECLYIGDSKSDVIASKAAGTKSFVALYGYIHVEDDPFSWEADVYINEPMEIIKRLNNI